MLGFYLKSRSNLDFMRVLLVLALLVPCCADAVEKITLLALFKDKAIFQIDGARRVLQNGQVSPEGVKLISANTEEATVEIAGKREVLKLGVVTASFSATGQPSVTLWADGNGFFHAEGSINNIPVKFLVDTGANTIAINSELARRIGIDYTKGQAGMATTASGYTRIYGVVLNAVKIGEIVLHNVNAGVIEGRQPETPLLGMSFLGGLEMRRDGNRMELIKRY
jgi:aspartyl protease family protein